MVNSLQFDVGSRRLQSWHASSLSTTYRSCDIWMALSAAVMGHNYRMKRLQVKVHAKNICDWNYTMKMWYCKPTNIR
jgi:hypothetical protein